MTFVRALLAALITAAVSVTALGELPTRGPISYHKLAAPPESQKIQWAGPKDGLMIGVQVPEKPLVFIPSKNWDGKVFHGGESTGWIYNSPGEWSSNAVFSVYLKNTSNHSIFWSASPRAWTITFAGDRFKPLKLPFPVSPFPPQEGSAIELSRGCVVETSIPLSAAFWNWPMVREGRYRVSVIYSSLGMGGPAFDVQGFWNGAIQSKQITVKIRHRNGEPQHTADGASRFAQLKFKQQGQLAPAADTARSPTQHS